jgi:mitogen-activated protein kinase 1/3
MASQRPQRQKQIRCLSNHITSRWYRPPEIILVEKNYNAAVDIWSLGCVAAEMLYCTDAYKSDPKHNLEQRFLFPVNSCFPLSPCEQMQKSVNKEINIVSKNDQLKKILDVIGFQDENDLSFVTDDSALDYHKSLTTTKVKGDLQNNF